MIRKTSIEYVEYIEKENADLIKERDKAIELLKSCMSELYTIHSQYGDKENARDHSVALTEAELFIKQIENGK